MWYKKNINFYNIFHRENNEKYFFQFFNKNLKNIFYRFMYVL